MQKKSLKFKTFLPEQASYQKPTTKTPRAHFTMPSPALPQKDLHDEQKKSESAILRIKSLENKVKELEEKLSYSEKTNKFLAKAGEALSSSLNYPETLTTVAQLAVPEIADWCVVDIIDEQGRSHRIAVVHKDPKKIKLARTLEREFPEDPNKDAGIRNVIKTGRSELYSKITDPMIVQAARTPAHLKQLRAIGFTSLMMVPLKINEKVLGVITFISAESKKIYTKDSLATAEELARRASIAIENARLYEAEKRSRYEMEERVETRTAELEKANDILQKEAEERIKIDNALRASEELLHYVLDTLPVAVWVMDNTGNVLLENPAGQEMWGQKTFIGPRQTDYKMWWADSGKPVLPKETAFVRAIEHGETSICEVLNIESTDGTKRTILNSAYPMVNNEQKTTGVIIVNEDISDRQKIAEELSVSKKELRDFIDSQSIFSAKLNASGQFLLINKSFAKILGVHEQEFSNHNFLDGKWWKYDPEAADRVAKVFNQTLVEKKSKGIDERLLTAENTTIVVSIRFIPILNAKKEIEYVLLEGSDVTEQKLAEQQLIESRNQLNEAQKIALLGSWQWDVFYNLVFWSDELCSIYGVKPGFKGTYEGFLQLVHEDDREHVRQHITKALTEKKAFDFKHRIVRPDGTTSTIHARGDVITNQRGEAIQIFGTAQDITKQEEARAQLELYTKQLEASRGELKREKALDDAIFSSVGEGIIATDTKGKIIMVNPRAEELLGFGEKELVGKNIFDALPLYAEKGEPVPLDKRPTNIVLTKGKKVVFNDLDNTYYYAKKNKGMVPVAITASPVSLKNKITGSVQVFRDISREREIDRAKTEFVSLASHQLRTPLSAINWYAETLISKEIGPINPKQKLYLEQMRQGNRRIIQLLNDLLNVSRIDLGTFIVHPTAFSIQETIRGILKDATPIIKQKNLSIKEKYDKKLKKMTGDINLTRIMVQNIIMNAIKYTPNKGTVSISVTSKNKDLTVLVSDTGLGIPAHQQQYVFNKMFRADNVQKANIEGSGLGLYMVKSITKFLGGDVQFTSKEGKGSSFFLNLPYNTKRKTQEGKNLL
jgi:PAS domain S-box-containing protein